MWAKTLLEIVSVFGDVMRPPFPLVTIVYNYTRCVNISR